jgi:hypothetical protein
MYVHIGDGQIALVSNIVAIINLADTVKRKSPRSQVVLINGERLNSDIGAATLSMRVKHSIDGGKRKTHSRSVTSRKRQHLSTHSRRKAGRVERKK